MADTYGAVVTAGIYQAPSIKVAEAAKVIENTQRDLNIGFVNELSRIFNAMDIDTYDVLRAAAESGISMPLNRALLAAIVLALTHII